MTTPSPMEFPPHGSQPEDSEHPIPPIPPTFPEGPPTSAIEEAIPAFLGIRRFIRAARLAWAEETVDERERHDKVIHATAEGAQLRRGFGSGHEAIKHTPIKVTERISSVRRQRQDRLRRKSHYERRRLANVYAIDRPNDEIDINSETTDSFTYPARPDNYVSYGYNKPHEARSVAQQKKVAKNDAGKISELGSDEHKARLYGEKDEDGILITRPVRMRRYVKRSETKAMIKDKRKASKKSRMEARLVKGAGELSNEDDELNENHTIFAKIRHLNIERAERKRDEHLERLKELRRLTFLRDRQKAQ